MKRNLLTRAFVRSASLLLAGLCAAALSGCLDDAGQATTPAAQPAVTRKSASAMTPEEIDRFRRAFEYAVSEGRFNAFNDAHYEHHHARQHGIEVLATSPMKVEIMPTTWGYRLLPWHLLIAAVKDVYSLFNFMPHVRMHLWAGGLDPANANVRGTVTCFNELAVDPVFWMLHCELDRYWYSWEAKHDGTPSLTGEDATFKPIMASPGKRYGSGRTYSLEELTDHAGLGYAYDNLF